MFAIALGKMIFGGLGYNLFNPAMIGRAFMMASFPVAMTIGWSIPRAWYSRLEAITTATPLGVMREHDLQAALHLIGGPEGWFRLLVGLRPGSIGEVSVVLILLGALVLLARGIIRVYGGYPEGICYAILLANAIAPGLDQWFRPRRVAATGSPS